MPMEKIFFMNSSTNYPGEWRCTLWAIVAEWLKIQGSKTVWARLIFLKPLSVPPAWNGNGSLQSWKKQWHFLSCSWVSEGDALGVLSTVNEDPGFKHCFGVEIFPKTLYVHQGGNRVLDSFWSWGWRRRWGRGVHPTTVTLSAVQLSCQLSYIWCYTLGTIQGLKPLFKLVHFLSPY